MRPTDVLFMAVRLLFVYAVHRKSSLDGSRGVQDGVRQALGLGKNCEVSRVRVRVRVTRTGLRARATVGTHAGAGA